MKRLHLVLLLAGVLAVGSAFTTTKTHRDPCDGLQIAHINPATGQPYESQLGTCDGDPGSCFYGESSPDVWDVPCDDIGQFVPATK